MGIGACILSVSGARLTNNERRLLSSRNPWGVILMGRSCVDRIQVRSLISDIQDATGRSTLIFIDQEGGRVARLRAPVWPRFPAAATYGDLYEAEPERAAAACRLGCRLLGAELSDLGILANCAPVGDMGQDDTHDSIGDRAFGKSPSSVVDLASAALQGLAEAGVVGCIKHMPGQGRANVDSHHDLPRIMASKDALEQDFGIFAALSAHSLMGMTGHVCYDAIAPGEAATVSQTVISEVIRQRIGFDGLLMTDDLGMEALGGRLSDRGTRAIRAGCDILLHCSGFLKDPDAILTEMHEIADAAGELSGRSLDRAQAVDERAQARPEPFDQEASWARYSDLLDPMVKIGGFA